MTPLAPQKRPTATVFQSYALFPSMTVGENVAYGLGTKLDRAERQRRVQESLARVEMAPLAERPVAALSGGQQQRVALARALAVEPGVLLFDEPLSNLDAELRVQTRAEIRALQQRLGITALYVTHDQEEALALSDRIAVLRQGRLVARARQRRSTPSRRRPTSPASSAARTSCAGLWRSGSAAGLWRRGRRWRCGPRTSRQRRMARPLARPLACRLVSSRGSSSAARPSGWSRPTAAPGSASASRPTIAPPEALFLRSARATVVLDDLAAGAENPAPSPE